MKVGSVVPMRFVLMALATALSACDSGTGPLPPTTLTLTPTGPIPIAVGQTTSLTATVQNNANTAVSFESSAPAIASVDPATGVVRGVAAGNATITAASVAVPSARGSVLFVVSGTGPGPNPGPVNISIQSLTTSTGAQADLSNASGQVNVLLNVDTPSGSRVDSVQVLMDNIVACSQAWTQGTGAGIRTSGSPTAAVSISCPVNTAEFNPATGVTRFANRSYALVGRIRVAGQTAASTGGLAITLRNTSFLQATLTTSRGSRVSGTSAGSGSLAPGLTWSAGNVSVTMTPVIYADGGNAGTGGLAQAVVSLTTSGRGVTGEANCQPTGNRVTDGTIAAANGGAGPAGSNAGATPNCSFVSASQSDTDPANGFSFSFPESLTMSQGGVRGVEDVITVDIVTVTRAGQAGPTCINPNPATNPQNPPFGSAPCRNAFAIDPASQLRLDNLAPRIAVLNITPATLGCGAAQGCFVNSPAQLTSTASTVDYGVDSQTNAFSYGTNPAALQPLPGSFGAVNESPTSTDYFFAVLSVDALGNSSGLQFATDVSAIVSPGATVVPAGATRIQKFGVDL